MELSLSMSLIWSKLEIMAYSVIVRAITEMSWTTPETDDEIPMCRSFNYRLDPSIHDMRNRKPEAPVSKMLVELLFSPSTILHMLANQMASSY
jgi:hypothetical protein